MTARVLSAGRRRPYAFPAALAALCAIATFVVASAENLPIRDPDGVGGPPLVRLSAILGVFMLLDVVPRALWAVRRTPLRFLVSIRDVFRERWTGRRLGFVLVGLFSFYIVYVAYRNFKGFLPFLGGGLHDSWMLNFDRWLFFGNDPATLLQDLLGRGVANEVLSFVYVIYLGFVPVSLAAALVWFGDARHGLWYASALCLNWILGAVSYYLLPSLGPAFYRPELFADLPASASSSLQSSLWTERLNVQFGDAMVQTGDLVQSIAAFASLHTSVVLTAALVAQLLRANRFLIIGLWTYLVLVMISTVYLGWHYVIDVPAGALIGVLSVWIGAWATGHTLRFSHPEEGEPSRSGGRPAMLVTRDGRITAGPSKVQAEKVNFMEGALNLPNVLSVGRILLVPVIVAVMLGHPDGSILAAALFAAGGITDIVDGHLARSRNLITPLGKLLDPTADKLLVIAALISLVAVDRLGWWVVGVIAAREVLVTALRAHAARQGVVIAAGPAGKAKMFLQVAMVLALMALANPFAAWVDVLVALTVALTVASGADYVRGYVKGRSQTRTATA